jgi:hypothetical protein
VWVRIREFSQEEGRRCLGRGWGVGSCVLSCVYVYVYVGVFASVFVSGKENTNVFIYVFVFVFVFEGWGGEEVKCILRFCLSSLSLSSEMCYTVTGD